MNMFDDDDDDTEKCDVCSFTIDEIIKESNYNYIEKCSKCVFKSCNKCMEKWYMKSSQCPQCRQYKTFDIHTNIPEIKTKYQVPIIHIPPPPPVHIPKLFNMNLIDMDIYEIPKNATNISDYIKNESIKFHPDPEKSTKILNVATKRYVNYNGLIGKKILKEHKIKVYNT